MWIIGGFNHETWQCVEFKFINFALVTRQEMIHYNRVQVARSHTPLDELVQNVMIMYTCTTFTVAKYYVCEIQTLTVIESPLFTTRYEQYFYIKVCPKNFGGSQYCVGIELRDFGWGWVFLLKYIVGAEELY